MPKLKTHKGAKARFHVTGRGKIMRVKGPKSHKRNQKAKRVKALFDRKIELDSRDRKRISRLISAGT